MKTWVFGGMLPFLVGCAVLTADPWGWMDDPMQQRWIPVKARFQEFTISFEVPIRSEGMAYQVRSDLASSFKEEEIIVDVPIKTEFPATPIATFHWDYWWGGFGKGSGVDFSLYAGVGFYGEKVEESFLSMTPNEFIDWRSTYWKKRFEGSDPWSRDRFFASYEAEVYRSPNSQRWVEENDALRSGRMSDFMLPIGEDHVLYLDFFVNEKSRNGLDPDPAWVERRWEMAYKILDTVEITPRPGKF